MALFSYPIVTPLAVLANLSSGNVNFVIKVLTFIIYLVALTKLYRRKILFSRRDMLIMLLLLFYSLRLVVDVFFYNISYEHASNFYVLSYFFILTFIPVISIVISYRFTGFRKLNSLALLLITAINILHLVVFIKSGASLLESFTGRMSVIAEGTTDKSIISPLTIMLL